MPRSGGNKEELLSATEEFVPLISLGKNNVLLVRFVTSDTEPDEFDVFVDARFDMLRTERSSRTELLPTSSTS